MPKSKSSKSKRKLPRRRSQSRAKQKTQKTAAKRVSRTGTGRLRVRHAYKSHLLTRKSSRRLRRLRAPTEVAPSDRRQLRRLVPPTAGG